MTYFLPSHPSKTPHTHTHSYLPLKHTLTLTLSLSLSLFISVFVFGGMPQDSLVVWLSVRRVGIADWWGGYIDGEMQYTASNTYTHKHTHTHENIGRHREPMPTNFFQIFRYLDLPLSLLWSTETLRV